MSPCYQHISPPLPIILDCFLTFPIPCMTHPTPMLLPAHPAPIFAFFKLFMAVPLLPTPPPPFYIIFQCFSIHPTPWMTHPSPCPRLLPCFHFCLFSHLWLSPCYQYSTLILLHHIPLYFHPFHSLSLPVPPTPTPTPHFRFFNPFMDAFYVHLHSILYIQCIYIMNDDL